MNDIRSDEQLCLAVASGDREAFAVVVGRYASRLTAFASRTLHCQHLAEDAVQNALLRFWQKPKKFNAGKAKFSTWIYKVVLNECLDSLRRQGSSHARVKTYVESCLSAGEAIALDAVELLQSEQTILERQIALEFALSRLNPREGAALNLVIYDKLPQAEAAQILGVSVKALESILQRAKTRLSQAIQRHDQEQSSTGVSASDARASATSAKPRPVPSPTLKA